MKHKTWFRLVLRSIGILLVGLAFPGVCERLGFAVTFSLNSGFGPSSLATSYYIATAGYIAQFILGVYLLSGGEWILNRIIPSNRPYCPECGYDLSKNTTDRCPECGVSLPPMRGEHHET